MHTLQLGRCLLSFPCECPYQSVIKYACSQGKKLTIRWTPAKLAWDLREGGRPHYEGRCFLRGKRRLLVDGMNDVKPWCL